MSLQWDLVLETYQKLGKTSGIVKKEAFLGGS